MRVLGWVVCLVVWPVVLAGAGIAALFGRLPRDPRHWGY